MGIKIKHFLKIFLIIGIGFVIISTLENLIFRDIAFTYTSVLFKGLFLGLFMGLFITLYHFHALKHLGITNITEEDLKPNQYRFIPSNISITEIVERLKAHGKDFIFLNNHENVIHLKKKISLKSWGDNITIRSTTKDSIRGYEISSKPKLFQYLDSGSGVSNILTLQKLITDASKTEIS